MRAIRRRLTTATAAATPRRSALYLPGSNARALEKARTLPADVVILDLEDAVEARLAVRARRQHDLRQVRQQSGALGPAPVAPQVGRQVVGAGDLSLIHI